MSFCVQRFPRYWCSTDLSLELLGCHPRTPACHRSVAAAPSGTVGAKLSSTGCRLTTALYWIVTCPHSLERALQTSFTNQSALTDTIFKALVRVLTASEHADQEHAICQPFFSGTRINNCLARSKRIWRQFMNRNDASFCFSLKLSAPVRFWYCIQKRVWLRISVRNQIANCRFLQQ